jgi:hypothetical protein
MTSGYFFTLTKSNSSVSSTVIVYLLGLQYMRNCAKWKIFLGSTPELSNTLFLYMLTNSFCVIFWSRCSSIYQIINSIYLRLSFIFILWRIFSMSLAVKYIPWCSLDRSLKTFIRYFYSVEFNLNSYNFYSIVFCFSTFFRFRAYALN